MKTFILAALIALGSAPLAVAHAEGEGNGPSFPGLQVPNVSVTTSSGPFGQRTVTTTEEHTSNVTADATTQTAIAQRNHTWAMLRAAEPNS